MVGKNKTDAASFDVVVKVPARFKGIKVILESMGMNFDALVEDLAIDGLDYEVARLPEKNNSTIITALANKIIAAYQDVGEQEAPRYTRLEDWLSKKYKIDLDSVVKAIGGHAPDKIRNFPEMASAYLVETFDKHGIDPSHHQGTIEDLIAQDEAGGTLSDLFKKGSLHQDEDDLHGR